MSELIRLRDLPGVRRISEIVLNPRNFQYPQVGYTWAAINDVSNSLFCITEYDTLLFEDDPRDPDEYELMFAVTELPFAQASALFEHGGWDISDGKSDVMAGAHHFLRQIVALLRNCVPGVRFCPDGTGKAAYDQEGEPFAVEEHFEKWVKAEAEKFLITRGKLLTDD